MNKVLLFLLYATQHTITPDKRHQFPNKDKLQEFFLGICPEAIKPTTVPTVTRIFLIQGLPPITLGSKVILSKVFMSIAFLLIINLVYNLRSLNFKLLPTASNNCFYWQY